MGTRENCGDAQRAPRAARPCVVAAGGPKTGARQRSPDAGRLGGVTQVKDRYKLFGEVALEKRYVTAEQLYQALTVQARAKVEGKMDKLLGQVLLELGHLSEDQIRDILDVLYPATLE